MSPKKHSVKIGDFDIAYWDEGEGLPLVFIHGNSSSKQIFSLQFASPLVEGYRLIAIDLPGHGDSSHLPNNEVYTIELYTRIIARFWDKLECQGGILIGHSLGGHLIIQSVPVTLNIGGIMIFGTPPLSLPPRIEEAFMPNPSLAIAFQEKVSQAELTQWSHACFSTTKGSPPSFFQKDFYRTDQKVRVHLANCLADRSFRDETDIIRRLNCPISILNGQTDSLCNKCYIERLAIPSLWQGKIHPIADASHTPQWEQPHLFNNLVDGFARSISTGPEPH
jgi:pimeloyl-ACP methyl ester carboxylesterase